MDIDFDVPLNGLHQNRWKAARFCAKYRYQFPSVPWMASHNHVWPTRRCDLNHSLHRTMPPSADCNPGRLQSACGYAHNVGSRLNRIDVLRFYLMAAGGIFGLVSQSQLAAH
jgi:hypothetical protein